jgi:hypothetical protein
MKIEERGLYLLVLRLKKGQKIKAGKLPKTYFSSGCYLYVGRAKRGLKKKLDRHLRKDKKLFWHIDYFLRKAEVMDIWIKLNYFDECRIYRRGLPSVLPRKDRLALTSTPDVGFKSFGFSAEFRNGRQEVFQFTQVFALEWLGNWRDRSHGFPSSNESVRISFIMNMTQDFREFSHSLGRADFFLMMV